MHTEINPLSSRTMIINNKFANRKYKENYLIKVTSPYNFDISPESSTISI